MWPTDETALRRVQQDLAEAVPTPWSPGSRRLLAGGCWVCFPRGLTGPGGAGDPAWAAAVLMRGSTVLEGRATRGTASAAYVPGLLALRMGAVMERAVLALDTAPDVLLLDATGRDHPRRAGLALHLGAVLGLPTIGVTHRPLLAEGGWPADERGATAPLRIGGTTVACWLRTRPGVRPLAVHPGWRVDLDTAVDVVLHSTTGRRTPEPLRQARHRARRSRAGSDPDRRAR